MVYVLDNVTNTSADMRSLASQFAGAKFSPDTLAEVCQYFEARDVADVSAVKQLVFAGLVFGMDQVQAAMTRVPFVETWDETVNETDKKDDFGDFGDFAANGADGADDGFGNFGDFGSE